MTEHFFRIKPHFSIVAHSENRLELRSGVWNPVSFLIEDHDKMGKLYEILKLLDGSHSSRNIAKMCQISISHVEEVIDHLQQNGVLEHSPSSAFEASLNSLSSLFSNNKESSETAQSKKVLLIGDNDLTTAIAANLRQTLGEEAFLILSEDNPLIHRLSSLKEEEWLYDGVSFLKEIEAYSSLKDYFVVLAFSQVNPLLAKNFNRIAHELAIPWMHVAIDGPFLLIGPTFLAKQSPCFDCMEKRITMNLRQNSSYQKYKQALADHRVFHRSSSINPLILPLIAAHAALEIANFVLTESSFTIRKLFGIYLPTMEIAFNEVLPLSSCEVCGPTLHRTDEQLYFDMQTLVEASR